MKTLPVLKPQSTLWRGLPHLFSQNYWESRCSSCLPPLPITPFSTGHITTTLPLSISSRTLSSAPFPTAGFNCRCTVTGFLSPLFGSVYLALEILPPGGHNRPVDFKEIVGFNCSAMRRQLCCCWACTCLHMCVSVCVWEAERRLDSTHVPEAPPRPLWALPWASTNTPISSCNPSLEYITNKNNCSFFTSRLHVADEVESWRWFEMWQGSSFLGWFLFIWCYIYIYLYF